MEIDNIDPGSCLPPTGVRIAREEMFKQHGIDLDEIEAQFKQYQEFPYSFVNKRENNL